MSDSQPVEVPKGEVRYTIGREHPVIARVAAGTTLRMETELNIGNVLHTTEDAFDESMVKLPFVNPVTGPVYVEGATPASVLVCRVGAMELIPPGFTALLPGLGPFVDWIRRRDFGVHSRVVDVQDGEVRWDERTRIAVKPMIGTIGTSPLLESISTIDNGPHGGNMDVQEIGPGATVYLPIEVDGALFYLGDCHAVQGDGELCGIGAIEIRTRTTVTLDLAPRPEHMSWPRLETDEHIAAIACARPLEDAFRLAVEELVRWMVADYGFNAPDAVMLLGQVAEARCTQLVNPKYTYIAKIAKRYLG
jgi:acetamidase/formamidase